MTICYELLKLIPEIPRKGIFRVFFWPRLTLLSHKSPFSLLFSLFFFSSFMAKRVNLCLNGDEQNIKLALVFDDWETFLSEIRRKFKLDQTAKLKVSPHLSCCKQTPLSLSHSLSTSSCPHIPFPLFISRFRTLKARKLIESPLYGMMTFCMSRRPCVVRLQKRVSGCEFPMKRNRRKGRNM